MSLLISEDEKFKLVKAGGYEFKIRFISPKDSILISNRRRNISGNAPIDSLTVEEFNFIENVAIVDICTEAFPKEFPSNESCMEWDCKSLVNELANEIRAFSSEIEEKLKKIDLLSEAKKSDYFVTAFFLKHFNVFPLGWDKDNLMQEQKIFLMYLIALTPSIEDWSFNIEYKSKIEDIKNLTEKDIIFEKSEMDLAVLHNKDINQLRKERLTQEKKKRIKELNSRYGVKEESEEKIEPVKEKEVRNDPSAMWDLLQGKGLIKNG